MTATLQRPECRGRGTGTVPGMRTATYEQAWTWKAPGEDALGAGASLQLCNTWLHVDTYPVGRDPRGRQLPVDEWAEQYAALRRLAGADGTDAPLATIELDGMTCVPVGYPFCSGGTSVLGDARATLARFDAPATPILVGPDMWRPRPDGGYDAPLELCGAPMLARLVPAGTDASLLDPDDADDAAAIAEQDPAWWAIAEDLYLLAGDGAGPLNQVRDTATGRHFVLLLLPMVVHP